MSRKRDESVADGGMRMVSLDEILGPRLPPERLFSFTESEAGTLARLVRDHSSAIVSTKADLALLAGILTKLQS